MRRPPRNPHYDGAGRSKKFKEAWEPGGYYERNVFGPPDDDYSSFKQKSTHLKDLTPPPHGHGVMPDGEMPFDDTLNHITESPIVEDRKKKRKTITVGGEKFQGFEEDEDEPQEKQKGYRRRKRRRENRHGVPTQAMQEEIADNTDKVAGVQPQQRFPPPSKTGDEDKPPHKDVTANVNFHLEEAFLYPPPEKMKDWEESPEAPPEEQEEWNPGDSPGTKPWDSTGTKRRPK
jgi:hypothetical protein